MADLKKTIEIIFSGVDELSGPMANMEKSLSSFGTGLGDIGAPFASVVEKVSMLNVAIAGIAVAGIKASSDIESATAKMQASLGLPTEEAERFATIAKDVYKAGYGEDLAASFEAVTLAQKTLGDSAETDIGKVVTQALQLEKAFGTDVNESLSAVDTLMSNFGITSDQAMSLIVTGFQEGLNGSGDFLDSINEYSTQFADGGADAGQFFSVMETGFQQGVLGTDKAADAFKEFRLRIQNESTTTNEALQSLGLDPVAFAEKMASGELSAIDAFSIIQQKLNETEDETVKFNAAVGLMGSPFENLGTTAALSINTTSTKLSELGQSLDDIKLDTFEQKFTAAWHTITLEFGDMSVWDGVKDSIADVFLDIAKSFDGAIDNVDFSGVADKFGEIWGVVQDALSDQDLDITSVAGMKNALNLVAKSLESVASVTKGIVESFEPAFDAVIWITNAFNDLDPDMQELIGNITGLGAQLAILGGVVAAGGVLISGITTFTAFFSTGGALATGVSSVIGLLTGPAGLTAAMLTVAAVGTDFLTGEAFQQWATDTKTAIADADFGAWAEKTEGYFKQVSAASSENLSGMDASLLTTGKNADKAGEDVKGFVLDTELIPAHKQTEIAVDADTEIIGATISDLDTIPAHKQTDIVVDADTGTISKTIADLDTIPAHKQTDVTIETDQASMETAKKTVEDAIPEIKTTTSKADLDGTSYNRVKSTAEAAMPEKKTTKGVLSADRGSFNSTKSAIDDAVPESKLMEIQIQGDIDRDIARIKASAETAQAAFEYRATVDVAEIEAFAATTTAAFDSVATAVSATASAAASMFDSLLGNWDKVDTVNQRWLVGLVERQLDLEERALLSQQTLISAQTSYMNARVAAMSSGESLITISSDGLEPILEELLWNIMEKVKIRASQESAEFLLGLDTIL